MEKRSPFNRKQTDYAVEVIKIKLSLKFGNSHS